MTVLDEKLTARIYQIEELVFTQVKPQPSSYKLVNHYKGLPASQPLIGYRAGLDTIIITDGKNRLSALAERLGENPDDFSRNVPVWVFQDEREARLAGVMINTLRQATNSYSANLQNVRVLAHKYYSKEDISGLTGLTKGQVDELLELAFLPDWLIELVETGKIARGVARKLSKYRDEPFAGELFALVEKQGKVTHAQIDQFVKQYRAEQTSELQESLPGLESLEDDGGAPPMARMFFDKALALAGEEIIRAWLDAS